MAAFSPLSQSQMVHRRSRPLQLRTEAGVVKLEVLLYGQDANDKHWGSPIRERWGLTTHQQLSLALEDKLAFTITATASYEEAAALAQKWGVPVTDSLLHSLTRRLGARAEARKQAQLKTTPVEAEPKRAPAKLGVLMLDGWQVRQRGPGWGRKKTRENRVEWHEWKTGVYYPQEKSARSAGGRGVIAGKLVIGWQGDPVEFGRRLHWEALRGGSLAMGPRGSGMWRRTDGTGPLNCSTSITPANTCGAWAVPLTGRMKPPPRDGPNRCATNCGMGVRKKCSPK